MGTLSARGGGMLWRPPSPRRFAMRKNLPVWLLFLVSACVGPRAEDSALGTKPGWGRGFSPEERETTVRAVPAAASPTVPETRLGKPGWGKRRH